MRFLTGVFLALMLAGEAPAQSVNTGHINAELVSETQGIAPGQTITVALRQHIQKGWHTYWRNAGDSGEATQIKWTLPSGWIAGEFVWPTPMRLPVGPLVNYGYEGEVLLPMTLTAPADARSGETVTLTAAAAFLVCDEICIPEDALLELSLPVTPGPAPSDPRWSAAIRTTLIEAPSSAGLKAAFQRTDSGLTLAVTGDPLKGADVGEAYFYPFASTVIDHAAPQAIERGPDGLTLTLAAGYDFSSGEGPETLAGVLDLGGRAYEINAVAGPASAGAAGLGPPPVRLSGGGANLNLLGSMLLAALGGLILNLMPCVFPVLAMKAASMAGHGEALQAARRQGLAFGAGVLATFLVLAAILIGLKAAGSAVGWGFQLQSSPVIAVLCLLMFAVALDLSGVFEVEGSFQNLGSGLAAHSGTVGAFFTGALAVVVAAPCTAPFMGPAMGWAFTQPPAATLAVFVALGVGFAVPFVAVAFVPALLSRLPKPGPWMDVFRKALAFPMYGAAAWLAWVLAQQTTADGLARLFAAAIILALAAWLIGIAQRRAIEGRRTAVTAVSAGVLTVLAVGAVVWPPYSEPGIAGAAIADAHLDYEPYSRERLADLRAQGKTVFVNFTAAWCLSCQVNERLALSTSGVAEAMDRTGAVYLKADWTRRDAVIAGELARFGRAGVPLYLVYSAKGGEPAILPSLLTEGIVVRALDKAARRS